MAISHSQVRRPAYHDSKTSMQRSLSPPPLRGNGTVILLLVYIFVACWVATQYTAYVWQYHPRLGTPLATIAQHSIYPPYAIIIWAFQYADVPIAMTTMQRAFYIWCVVFTGSVVITMIVRTPRSTRQPSDAHGTARWGIGEILRQPNGLLLGRLDDIPLRYNGDGHLVTIAPTRSGKGVSVIIPNLLTYPGSVVVTDPKGENYAVTARRRQELGTTVVAFDPFGVVGGTAAFNPVEMIDTGSADAVDNARLLADMLVVIDSKESGEAAFWNEEARALLTGLILYVAAEASPSLRTLPHLRTLLTLPPTLFTELLTRMSASDAANGLVARAAARLLQKAEKERSGVISSAQSHTHFLDSMRMTTVLSHSTVDLATLNYTATSLFLILPPERLESYHRWIRLMIASCLHAVTRTARPAKPERNRIVFLIDEFGHLGRLRPIEQHIGLAAGYGVSFWLFVQDLSQLKSVYAQRWSTFLANADILQTFGANDWDTAEYISKMTGDATVFTDSENRSRSISYGKQGSRQMSAAATLSERSRRLLLPDEVRRSDRQVVFVKRSDPILADQLCYFTPRDPLFTSLFAGHFDPNPLHG